LKGSAKIESHPSPLLGTAPNRIPTTSPVFLQGKESVGPAKKVDNFHIGNLPMYTGAAEELV
jgi:hypothetical protein